MQPPLVAYPATRRRGLGLAMVVALHALLLWGLQSGMGTQAMHQAQVVVNAVLLREDRPASKASVPAPTPTPIPVPKPATAPQAPPQTAPVKPLPAQQPSPAQPRPALDAVASPAPSPSLAANAVTAAPPSAAAKQTPAVPSAATGQAAGRSEPARTKTAVQSLPCEKPEYPSASKRLEEEGVVHLRFLVGIDGRVVQSELVKSSGYKRLDEAARASLALCPFRPATVDGKPEQAWVSVQYTWRID